MSAKQTNHLGKISFELLLWSPLHCLCESFDKQAAGKLGNGLWNFPAVSSEWILHQLVQGKPFLSPSAWRTGGLVQTHNSGATHRVAAAQTIQIQPPGFHPAIPSRGSSRLSYTDEFDFRVSFLCPFLQEGIPTRSCGHKTLRQGTAEPRAASKALNAALARLGQTPSNAIAAC